MDVWSSIVIARGIVLQPENSIDVEPSPTVLYDMSRFRNDGAFTGAGEPDWVQLPSDLWVQEYDGLNDTINCGNDASLDLLTLTLESWITLAQQPADFPQASRTILEKNGAYYWFMDRAARVIRCILYSGGATGYNSFNNVWVLNNWYHIALVVDGSNVRFYLNGIPNGAPAQTNNPNITANNARFGSSNNGASYWWYGRQGCQRVYNYVLTPGQILQRYETTKHWFGVHN